MKKSSILYAVIVSGLFSCQPPKGPDAVTSEPREAAEVATGTKFTVNTSESLVEWIGTKVSGYHTGTVKLKSGELTVSNGEITSGTFVLDMNSIVASGPDRVGEKANSKLTTHLHSPDFFDVNKFAEATFVITGVKQNDGSVKVVDDQRGEKLNKYKITNPTHSISGNLTVKGLEKNIEFPAEITVSNESVEARAKFNIDRKLWDITYTGQPDDLIRDEIHIGIYLKADK